MATRIRLPNGQVRTADRVRTLTGTGLRRVDVKVIDKNGRRVRVSGYVSTRDRKKVRTFIVNKAGVNAKALAA